MSVDLEAIAQRGRCDVSSLRLAIPLLEQGYSPPFLARYRRDELGGIDESSLWALATALQSERHVQGRREELIETWQRTSLQDPAIGNAIRKSNSLRMLSRLSRRLKLESNDAADDSVRLAVRLLNPQKGDGKDVSELAARVEGISDPAAAVAGVDAALAKRLAGDPRMMAAAVRWLSKHAKIHIANIHDPHLPGPDADEESGDPKPKSDSAAKSAPAAKSDAAGTSDQPVGVASSPEAAEAQPAAPDPAQADAASGHPDADSPAAADSAAAVDSALGQAPPDRAEVESAGPQTPVNPDAPPPEPAQPTAGGSDASPPPTETSGETDSTGAAEPAETLEPAETSESAPGDAVAGNEQAEASTDAANAGGSKNEPAAAKGKGKPKSKGAAAKSAAKKQKKISPRQRRRRWLIGVLKPLEGKRFGGDKLSAFQIVMLGRALRSQVAECSFEYDATKLVAELQRAAGTINRALEPQLKQIVLDHEADIREAAEAAWWDDLHEKASARLVTTTADHLRRHVNRGPVEAKVVMSIDAVGPRTAATSIVCADGRILHNEDLPCQLSSALRSQAVARMGELIHSYHVDLIVVSNGPSRRGTLIALGDLISQSPDKSVRWTLADRTGADVYSGSGVADEEMRSTPRRFRAASWLAFSVLQPAQALAKIDPLKLRLSSFQRELADEALAEALEDVMTSGASRGGVDVNSAPVSWLMRLPGVTSEVAQSIDRARREELFHSRREVSELPDWQSVTSSRQALPFLRVFNSEEVLDGTLIHPDDYPLAKKLASALEIELPPKAPPGYEPPDFSEPTDTAAEAPIAEAPSESKPIPVEDFSNAGDRAREFSVDEATGEASTTQTASPVADDEHSDQAMSDLSPDSDQTPDSGESTSPGSEADGQPDLTTSAEGSAATKESDDANSPAVATDEGDHPSQASAEGNDSSIASQSAATGDAGSGEADAAGGEQAESSRPTSIAKEDIPEPIRRPRPERQKIAKCVKEWQIGARRAHQLVQWLCDPFGDSDTSGTSPAVLTSMPSSKNLQPDEMVVGVVVGVMPFGVFVELAPDCSGLIHVSRVSESYVEDLHEAVQVGDVVTAWVTGIDEKRRRVALTAISPERQAEIDEARRSRPPRGQQGGSRRGGYGRGQAQARTPSTSGQAGQGGGGRGEKVAGGQARGGQARGGQGRGGQGRGGGRPGRGDSQGGRGGRGRDKRSGGRGREKKPESYRVVSKPEAKPITDAMQKGEEPLRSFGDLMQFFDKTTSSKPEAPEAKASENAPTPDRAAPEDASPGNDSAAESPEKSATDADPAASKRSAEGTAPTENAPAAGDSGQQDAPGGPQETPQESAAGDASGGQPEPAQQTPSAEATSDAGSGEPPSPADKPGS